MRAPVARVNIAFLVLQLLVASYISEEDNPPEKTTQNKKFV